MHRRTARALIIVAGLVAACGDSTAETGADNARASGAAATSAPAPTPLESSAPTLRGTPDLPGTTLPIDVSIRSSVDRTTRAREVFALALTGGQQVRLELHMPSDGSIELIYPGALSLNPGAFSRALSGKTSNGAFAGTFLPAVNGTYAVVVNAATDNQAYALTVTSTGVTSPTAMGATDVPGTALAFESSVRSVVDAQTRRREVFAVALTAGQEIRLTLDMSSSGAVQIVTPGNPSLDLFYSRGLEGFVRDGRYAGTFMPAISGTFAVVVNAGAGGQAYKLTVVPSGTNWPALRGGDDFPGAPLTVGSSIRSVVDNRIRKLEVYAVALTAGQPVTFTLDLPTFTVNVPSAEAILGPSSASLEVVNPGFTSLSANYARALSGETSNGRYVATFTPTAGGTYAVVVRANTTGQPYALSVSAA